MNPFEDITLLPPASTTDAQQALGQALVELLLQKPFAKISVKALTQTAHVARSTFYAYYQNTDELLADVENKLVLALIDKDDKIRDRNRQSAADFSYFSAVLDYVNDHEMAFAALLKPEDSDQRFIQKWKTGMKYNLWARIRPEMTTHNKFILELVSAMMIASIRFYLSEHVLPDQDEIYTTVAKTLKLFDL